MNINYGEPFHLKGLSMLRLPLLILRLFLCATSLGYLYFFQTYICPLLFISIVRRYLHSVLSLITLRFVLLIFGVVRYEISNFKFFRRKYIFRNQVHRSYIGIATHRNFIDVLFYSYLLNPVFTIPVYYVPEDREPMIYYSPLSTYEMFQRALVYRGLEPIRVSTQEALRKLKMRKMLMHDLVTECFEQLRGPILILLPSQFGRHLPIDVQLAGDISQNKEHFQRNGVGLHTVASGSPSLSATYPAQIDLILTLLSELQLNSLRVYAREFRGGGLFRNRGSDRTEMDNFFVECELPLLPLTLMEYYQHLNALEEEYYRSHREEHYWFQSTKQRSNKFE